MAASKNTEISAAELEIKRRGRRRLIGAITLGLLAVVFLPMIFDSEPKRDVQGQQEISVQLPDKDKAPALPAPVVSAPAATPVAGTPPAATTPVPETAPAAPAVTPATKDKPVAPPAEKAKPAAAAPVVAPAAAPPAAAPKPKPPAAAAATPSAAKEAPAAAPIKGGFAVQVAALKDVEHAKQLVAKLKELKLPVTTDTLAINSGKVTRIRVGPYADKAKAESVLAEIKLSGIDGGKVIPLKP